MLQHVFVKFLLIVPGGILSGSRDPSFTSHPSTDEATTIGSVPSADNKSGQAVHPAVTNPRPVKDIGSSKFKPGQSSHASWEHPDRDVEALRNSASREGADEDLGHVIAQSGAASKESVEVAAVKRETLVSVGNDGGTSFVKSNSDSEVGLSPTNRNEERAKERDKITEVCATSGEGDGKDVNLSEVSLDGGGTGGENGARVMGVQVEELEAAAGQQDDDTIMEVTTTVSIALVRLVSPIRNYRLSRSTPCPVLCFLGSCNKHHLS